MKLYHSPKAPNPERVVQFLRAKGKLDAVEVEEISIMEQQHRTPEYRALSPFAQVPVLVLSEEKTGPCLWQTSVWGALCSTACRVPYDTARANPAAQVELSGTAAHRADVRGKSACIASRADAGLAKVRAEAHLS